MTQHTGVNRRQATAGLVLSALGLATSHHVFAQSDKLNIGMVSPLTGAGAAYGADYAEGAKAYVKAWNERGGYKGQPVGFTLLDDESTSVGAMNAFKKLSGDPSTNMIWLASSSSAIVAVKAIVDEAKVPVIAGGILDAIGIPPAAYMFKVAPGTPEMQKVVTRWAARKGYKRMAMMYPTDGFGQAEILTARKMAAENNLELVAAETFQNTDTNFTTQLAKLRASRPDVVYIAASGAPAILIYKQYRQLKLDFPLAMTQSAISRGFFESIGGPAAAKGVHMATNVGSLGTAVPGASGRLFGDMEKGLGRAGTLFTTFGWDHGILTEWAVNAAGTSRQALRDKLESAKDVPAINGPFTFTSENHIGQDYRGVTMAVHNGEKFVVAN